MMSFTDSYKQILLPIIQSRLPEAKIILYGSRARQQERGGSDIDIALDMGVPIDGFVLAEIVEGIEESMLPVNFDIVDFHAVSADLQEEILKDGVFWF